MIQWNMKLRQYFNGRDTMAMAVSQEKFERVHLKFSNNSVEKITGNKSSNGQHNSGA